jgi:hypothetical protein
MFDSTEGFQFTYHQPNREGGRGVWPRRKLERVLRNIIAAGREPLLYGEGAQKQSSGGKEEMAEGEKL